MDREAWHVAVHGIAKSETGLSDWTELNNLTIDKQSRQEKRQAGEVGSSINHWTCLNLKFNSKPWRERQVSYHHHKLLFTSSNICYPCSNLLKLFNAGIIVSIYCWAQENQFPKETQEEKQGLKFIACDFMMYSFYLKKKEYIIFMHKLRLNWLSSFMQSLLSPLIYFFTLLSSYALWYMTPEITFCLGS